MSASMARITSLRWARKAATPPKSGTMPISTAVSVSWAEPPNASGKPGNCPARAITGHRPGRPPVITGQRPQGAGHTPAGHPQGAGHTPAGHPQGAGHTPAGHPQGVALLYTRRSCRWWISFVRASRHVGSQTTLDDAFVRLAEQSSLVG